MQNNIKQVSSLPSDIIVNAEQFVIVYKKRMFWYVIPAFSYFLMPESLGPVDLSRLFLQRIVGHFYKAETSRCSYST